MRSVVVGLVMLMVSAAVTRARADDVPGKYRIAPAPEWNRDVGAEAAVRAGASQAEVSDVVVFDGPVGAKLVAYYTTADDVIDDEVRAGLLAFNRGVMGGVGQSGGTPVGELRVSELDGALVGAQTFASAGRLLDVRVETVADKRGATHAAMAVCTRPDGQAEAACAAALASLHNTWPSDDRLGLDARRDGGRRHSSSYELGRKVGQVAGALLVIWLLVWAIRRRRR